MQNAVDPDIYSHVLVIVDHQQRCMNTPGYFLWFCFRALPRNYRSMSLNFVVSSTTRFRYRLRTQHTPYYSTGLDVGNRKKIFVFVLRSTNNLRLRNSKKQMFFLRVGFFQKKIALRGARV